MCTYMYSTCHSDGYLLSYVRSPALARKPSNICKKAVQLLQEISRVSFCRFQFRKTFYVIVCRMLYSNYTCCYSKSYPLLTTSRCYKEWQWPSSERINYLHSRIAWINQCIAFVKRSTPHTGCMCWRTHGLFCLSVS